MQQFPSQPGEKCRNASNDQWEFQDPKMEVLYHIRPYFGGIPLPLIMTRGLMKKGENHEKSQKKSH